MSQFVEDAIVTRSIGECLCPGAPHPADTVDLDAVLDLPTGLAAIAAMRRVADRAVGEGRELSAQELGEATAPVYLSAVRGWNFVDEAGEPVPFSPTALARLKWPVKYRIAEACDELYGTDLLSPLVETTPKPSNSGRTASSTSVNRQSRRHPVTPSPSSSRASSAGLRSVSAP